MSTGRYLLGVTELAVIAATLGLGAYHLRALLVPAWTGALARLAEIVIGISMLILASEVLGIEVRLRLGCIAAGLGATYYARRHGLPEAPPALEAQPSRLMIAIGVAAAALVVIHWAHPTGQALDKGMYYQDTTWYHMSFS